MKKIKKTTKALATFAISLVMSVVLHIFFIAGISGVNGLGFFIPITHKVFSAKLVFEKKPPPVFSKKTYAPPPHKPAKQDVMEKPASPDKKLPEPAAESSSAIDSKNDVTAVSGETENSKQKENVEAETEKPEEEILSNIAEKGLSPHDKTASQTETFSAGILRTAHEKLYYDIYWLGIYVGRAVIEAVNKNGVERITSEVHSAAFISAFYRVEDYAESTLVDGMPVNFRIKQREGRYRSDKETVFDIYNKKITFFNYLKGTTDEHNFTGAAHWDVFSGFYFLRTMFFDVGKTVYIDIFDSNKFLKAEVSVLGKEKIKLYDDSEVDTLLVKPSIKSEGMFQNKGDIFIWLTDDESRIPVRIETKIPIGKVVAELKAMETGK